MLFATIAEALKPTGLILRGGFHPEPADAVPGHVGTLVLIGNAGAPMWRAFERGAGEYAGSRNPLDDWVRDRLTLIAGDLGATALFPFGGPPFLPFQRWAQRAEPSYPSPLRLLIHPDYGLWHAYRGALAFPEKFDLPAPDSRPSPCASCADKPCLGACPVEAFTGDGYDVPACVSHLATRTGADCVEEGCRARRACPIGREFVYAPEQAEFHMRAFFAANRGG